MIFRRTIGRTAMLTMVLAVTAFANAGERVALAPWMVARAGERNACDLLHERSAPGMRNPAVGVIAAEPPHSCAPWTARHSELQHSLSNAPQLSAAVAVPSTGELTHPSRVLSRAEILVALESSATVNQFPGLQSLNVEDIVSAPAILVAEATPTIEITRIEPDSTGTATRARLWIPAEPRIPPFWITLRRVMTPPGPATNGAASRSIVPGTSTNSVASGTPIATADQTFLIRRGKPVELVMQAAGIRITAAGTALEPGRPGQKIRVRSVLAGKIVVATVLDAQTVELDY
jgi:flagella basal body P-ring formation protein FlgA